MPPDQMGGGGNFVDVNFKIDQRTGRIIIMGAMDNMVKGAKARQCRT